MQYLHARRLQLVCKLKALIGKFCFFFLQLINIYEIVEVFRYIVT